MWLFLLHWPHHNSQAPPPMLRSWVTARLSVCCAYHWGSAQGLRPQSWLCCICAWAIWPWNAEILTCALQELASQLHLQEAFPSHSTDRGHHTAFCCLDLHLACYGKHFFLPCWLPVSACLTGSLILKTSWSSKQVPSNGRYLLDQNIWKNIFQTIN